MLVSFIIPHKGREELLERTIRSILALEFEPQNIEILVLTQNKTLAEPPRDSKEIPLRILFRPEHETIAALRNVGAKHAAGDYLAFLDADVELSRNWLTLMFQELAAKPERALVSAIQQGAPDAGPVENIRVLLNNTAADKAVKFLGSANLFLPRKIFERVDGFPEHLTTCEDYYFTNQVHRIGEVYCTSQASFIHLGEDKNYPALFRKEIWRGQANLQSLRRRKILFREIPSILTPLWEVFFFLGMVMI